jgi:hypothetical protein
VKVSLLESNTNLNSNTSKSKLNKRGNSIMFTSKIDPKITLMVLAVVVAFFCCQFPYLILHLCSSTRSHTREFQIAKAVCDFLTAFNCCINFLIYCFFGQNFRRIAKFILLNPTFSPYNQALMQRNENRRAEERSKQHTQMNEIRRPLDQISKLNGNVAESNSLLNEDSKNVLSEAFT